MGEAPGKAPQRLALAAVLVALLLVAQIGDIGTGAAIAEEHAAGVEAGIGADAHPAEVAAGIGGRHHEIAELGPAVDGLAQSSGVTALKLAAALRVIQEPDRAG